MLNDGVYGKSIFPPTLCKKLNVPTASVLQLFTTPYTLITGQPGKVIVPEQAFYVKQAGTAYAINGASLVTAWGTVLGFNTFPAANLVGFMDVSTLAVSILFRPLLSGVSQTVVPTPTIVGQSITLLNTVANFTNGIGDITIWITFRVFDVVNLGWL